MLRHAVDMLDTVRLDFAVYTTKNKYEWFYSWKNKVEMQTKMDYTRVKWKFSLQYMHARRTHTATILIESLEN